MRLSKVALSLIVIFLCTDVASCLFCGLLDFLFGGYYYYPSYYGGGGYYYYPNYRRYRRRRYWDDDDDYWNETSRRYRSRRTYRRRRNTSRCYRDSAGYLRCRSYWPWYYRSYAMSQNKTAELVDDKKG